MLHKRSDSVEPAGGGHRLPSWEFSWHIAGRFGTWGSWHEVTSLLELTGPREPPPTPAIARILAGISGALAYSSSFCPSLQLWLLRKNMSPSWISVTSQSLTWRWEEKSDLWVSQCTHYPERHVRKPCWSKHMEWTKTREQRPQREAPKCPGSSSEAVSQGYSVERRLPFLLGARNQRPTDGTSALLMLDPKTQNGRKTRNKPKCQQKGTGIHDMGVINADATPKTGKR